jgi:hypothetical protein
LKVTLHANGEGSAATFKGFLIQLRDQETNRAIGSFDSSKLSKTLECSGEMTTATHNMNDNKSTVTLLWSMPEGIENPEVLRN